MRRTVASLDISGHGIGDEGLGLLAQLAESSLSELRFDRNCPSYYEVLCGMAQRMAASPVTSIEWPEDDGRRVLQLVPPDMRPWLSRRLNTAKKHFEAKETNGTDEPVEVILARARISQRGSDQSQKNVKSVSVMRSVA
jgi:hypothetical protein